MKILLFVAAFGLSWCGGPITDQHHETALYYGGTVLGAQAKACTPILGLLHCKVYHPYGEPYEMWCDDQICEFVQPSH